MQLTNRASRNPVDFQRPQNTLMISGFKTNGSAGINLGKLLVNRQPAVLIGLLLNLRTYLCIGSW